MASNFFFFGLRWHCIINTSNCRKKFVFFLLTCWPALAATQASANVSIALWKSMVIFFSNFFFVFFFNNFFNIFSWMIGKRTFFYYWKNFFQRVLQTISHGVIFSWKYFFFVFFLLLKRCFVCCGCCCCYWRAFIRAVWNSLQLIKTFKDLSQQTTQNCRRFFFYFQCHKS